MNIFLISAGISILIISLVIFGYDYPRLEVFNKAMGMPLLGAFIMKDNWPTYFGLTSEVFYSQIGIIAGIVAIIVGVVIKRQKKISEDL